MASSSTAAAAATLLLLLALCLISGAAAQPREGSFNCSARATCQSVVDYSPVNATTLSGIKTLFGVKKLYALLGANNLSPSTPANTAVAANKTIRVPFPCLCNGSGVAGVSNRVPIYTVKEGDGLDYIARQVFSELVTYQQIAAVNNISNPDLIKQNQELWIPLPCSCDEVNGMAVVHYGHLVAAGSTVAGIAQTFGTTEETLLKLNAMVNASQLLANQILDVPLKACSSSIRNDSLDSSLLVPNGTYAVTAHQCVICSCDSANNWTLQCEPSQLKPTNWTTCPSARCSDSSSFSVVNTTSSGTCTGTTCAYAGYNNQTIFTTLVQQPTCPASNNTNAASKMGLQAWSWNFLSIFIIQLVLLGLFSMRW